MALAPKSENTVTDGDGNVLTGHNSGTISIGYTVEQHEAALQRALAEKQADLERAHGAERALLQREADEFRAKLANLEADHSEQLTELERVKRLLARHENRLDSTMRDAAFNALDIGETKLAEVLLKELARAASLRREDAAKEEAEFEFEIGKIAEGEVRWDDAAEHFAKAARLDPSYEVLAKAGNMLWHAGRYAEAVQVHEALGAIARRDHGAQHKKTALAANNLALTYHQLGRFKESEPLYREALEIKQEVLGARHPDTATGLNNLAALLEATGRYEEAEPLYREALEIKQEVLGARHPDTAGSLNNLAGLLRATGRYEEAEPLYREALEIKQEVLGARHPDTANSLYNLALLLQATERSEEAEPLLVEALEICEAGLGPDHPHTQLVRENLEGLRAARDVDPAG